MELTGCTVDLVRGRLVRQGEAVALTTREADLLRYLAANPSRVIPRDELLRAVWGYSDAVLTRASDNTVRRLRTKLELDPARPDHVLTVHGVGYRFEPGGSTVAEESSPPAPTWTTLAAGIQLDLPRRRVRREGRPEEELTESEATLLAALMRTAGFADRGALSRAVWGYERRSGRALDGLVGRLRRKIEADPAEPALLLTARGGGYRLERAGPLHAAAHGLIGRDELLAEVVRAHQQPGWVLLLGFAGTGKSSLARAAAPHAPWADLAPAADVQQAARILALTLDLAVEGDDPLQRVALALQHRPEPALVLDNLEGVAGAAELVERMRALAPRLRLLGTSRVRLEARGEQVIEVDPLPASAAAELFALRARQASSVCRDLGADDPRIAEIARQLDGVPLALELAATRTAVMDLDALRERLGVDLLHRTRSGRHGSLGAVIDASLRGLTGSEREALTTLSLFGSGFDVEDAEGLLGEDAVDVLQALRDHSLVRRLPSDDRTVRFGVWQSVREVLADHVGEETERRWCAHLARQGAPGARDRLGWEGTDADIARLLWQVGDLERAARLSLARGEPDVAAACAEPVVWISQLNGPYAPGIALAEQVLAAGPGAVAHAYLLGALVDLRGAAGQWDRAIADAVEASERARRIDAPALEIRVRIRAATTESTLHGNAAALPHADAAALVSERAGMTDGTSPWSRCTQARLRDRHQEERHWLRLAAREAKEAGNRLLLRRAQLFLAHALTRTGELAEARALFEEVFRSCDLPLFRWARLNAANHITRTLSYAGDLDAARHWAGVHVELARSMGARGEECRARLSLARLARDLTVLDAIEQDFGTTPDFAELAAEVELLRAQLTREQGDLRASIRAAERSIAADPGADPGRIAVFSSELAMSQLAAGEIAAARATLDRTPPPIGLHRMHRRALEALLARAEGARAPDLSEVRAEAAHLGRELPDGDDEVLIELLGPWVPAVLAR